ncbi:hypothetical protein M3Y94_00892800 [Aphelenchoides besseyi]|nr:hypothetical protein M3Y94_00892800 [Aphelenchoides besseyi]
MVERTVGMFDLHTRRFKNDKMFPEMKFDEELPYCALRTEPCGFYSFSLNGNHPFKFVSSWCRCSPESECVYERTDLRMRVFRQVCQPSSNRSIDPKSKTFPPKEAVEKLPIHHSRNRHHVHRQHKTTKNPKLGDVNISQFVSVDEN